MGAFESCSAVWAANCLASLILPASSLVEPKTLLAGADRRMLRAHLELRPHPRAEAITGTSNTFDSLTLSARSRASSSFRQR